VGMLFCVATLWMVYEGIQEGLRGSSVEDVFLLMYLFVFRQCVGKSKMYVVYLEQLSLVEYLPKSSNQCNVKNIKKCYAVGRGPA
jgi:hypothetical protein